MECAICAKDTVISIHMQIGGEEVVFQRCSVCETSNWNDDAGERSLGDILDLARVGR